MRSRRSLPTAAAVALALLTAAPAPRPVHAQPSAGRPAAVADTAPPGATPTDPTSTVSTALPPAADTARPLVPVPRSAPPPRAGTGTLSAAAVRAPLRAELRGGAGPAVLHAQILLGAAGFSPGVLDGRFEGGTRAAVRAFRTAHGLGDGEALTEEVYARLSDAAQGRPPVVSYTLARADVRGPLRRIPASNYDKARLDCLCYETVAERLAERFHTTPDVLRRLNAGVDLDAAAEGTEIVVPNVWRLPPRAAPARLVVDKGGGTLRGYDSTGALLFSLRASVGSPATPSPTGVLRVRKVTLNPWYQYNPRVLTGKAGARGRVADLAPGPNSPVGVVWIQLSKAHIGIHGTPAPERVGSAQSHGCVRLTNWDALFLAGVVAEGVAVEFP